MATAQSSGSGTVTVPASEVNAFIQKEIGFSSSFFLTISKSRVLADGSLQANYTFDNTQQPPPPQNPLGVEASESVS